MVGTKELYYICIWMVFLFLVETFVWSMKSSVLYKRVLIWKIWEKLMWFLASSLLSLSKRGALGATWWGWPTCLWAQLSPNFATWLETHSKVILGIERKVCFLLRIGYAWHKVTWTHKPKQTNSKSSILMEIILELYYRFKCFYTNSQAECECLLFKLQMSWPMNGSIWLILILS